MAIAILDYVFENSTASGTARLVLLALADRARPDGECWPGIADIAKRANVGVRATQKAIRRLCKCGELRVIERGGGTQRNGRGRTNRYLVVAGRSNEELASLLNTLNAGTGYGATNPERPAAKPRPAATTTANGRAQYPEPADGGTNKQPIVNRKYEPQRQSDTERAFHVAVANGRAKSAAALAPIGDALPRISSRRIPDGELDRSVALLQAAGLGDTDAHGLAKCFGYADIERAAEMLQVSRQAGKPIGNAAGWLRTCIKGRWWENSRDAS